MTLWNDYMKRGLKDNPTKLSTRNDKESYSKRLNHIVSSSQSVPPLLDMRKQMKKVRQSNKTIPLSVYNGTTSRVK
jgi:hypothetical protein